MIKIRSGPDFTIVTASDQDLTSTIAGLILEEVYDKSDLCMRELLPTIEIIGVSLEKAVAVVGHLLSETDGDKLVRINDDDDIHEVFN